jgi:4-hydroxy-tetrahydrodipicolinate reductase
MIKAAVVGADGKMGVAICEAIDSDSETELVERFTRLNIGEIEGLSADVVVDVTNAQAAAENLPKVASNRIHAVVGTSGLSGDQLEILDAAFRKNGVCCLVVPNFAIAAVLQMRFAAIAAPFFDTVVVEERHHMQKIDAPSGLSHATAAAIAEARGGRPWAVDPTESETVPGVRGGLVEGVPVHSIRSPGVVARQEVSYGAQGQSLILTYDTIDRSSFMPGVLLAIKHVAELPRGVTVGLDTLLGF